MDVERIVAGLSEDDLDAIGDAIEAASCPGREGPYGSYDYGHNTAFYGPEPEGGRYVIRDFRDYSSDIWGSWVHQTADRDEHEAMFERLTRRHAAQAAVNALRARVTQGEHTAQFPGMTLRDWLAGQALSSMDLKSIGVRSDGVLTIAAAQAAYSYADAMIAARLNEGQG